MLAIENVTVGGAAPKAKRVNKYDVRVKEIMAKNSIKSLAEASKYIKDQKFTYLAKARCYISQVRYTIVL